MSEQENTRIVESAYEAFKQGDIGSVLDLYSEDAEGEIPGPPDMPIAGSYNGREGVEEFLTKLTSVQEAQRFEVHEFIAQGDKVVVLGEYAWRVKATGDTYGCKWAHVLTVDDGKITRFVEYADTAAAAACWRP